MVGTPSTRAWNCRVAPGDVKAFDLEDVADGVIRVRGRVALLVHDGGEPMQVVVHVMDGGLLRRPW